MCWSYDFIPLFLLSINIYIYIYIYCLGDVTISGTENEIKEAEIKFRLMLIDIHTSLLMSFGNVLTYYFCQLWVK